MSLNGKNEENVFGAALFTQVNTSLFFTFDFLNLPSQFPYQTKQFAMLEPHNSQIHFCEL